MLTIGAPWWSCDEGALKSSSPHRRAVMKHGKPSRAPENPLRPPCPPWFNPEWGGVTAESTEVAEGLRTIPLAPRIARRDQALFVGPPSCRCREGQDRERVAGAASPLRPPCPPWFNPEWGGVTAESTEVAEGLRMISITPRLARRDEDCVWGGWGRLIADAGSARSGTCRGSRPPSASSVFSAVQSGVRWGGR